MLYALDSILAKGINSLFVAIVEGLLVEKPDNPVTFIIEFLCKQYPEAAIEARIPQLIQVENDDGIGMKSGAQDSSGF